jgi:basic membrane protein A
MVTDVGGLGDQSFNDSAYRGLKQAEAELGVQVQVMESKEQSDYETNLSSLAEKGTDLVFAVGFMMTDSVKETAPQYPETNFAIIDGAISEDDLKKLPNVTQIKFKEEEGSYLVGLLAGAMTRSNKVGFVGGQKSPLIEKFEAGYKAGVKTANPKAEVLVAYTDSFVDQAKGKEQALALFNKDADIVFHASGACGLGVIAAAKEKGEGFYAIGVDSDQDSVAPGRVLTSMMKYVDKAVFATVQDLKNGRIRHGTQVYGVKEGGVGLSPMTHTKDKVPPEVMAKVKKLQESIASGKLTIPDTLEKLKSFTPPAF